ncbi:MAG: hypothetical protein B7Z73_05420 [Planctomycetia bacterium 21-64-5]|nr:MAG: hypothetical protein B7Z73_05420 [Planctomycetia bacterium 21-64-5]HQU43795.1 hypothetical protein [Pirellulales bacterium]
MQANQPHAGHFAQRNEVPQRNGALSIGQKLEFTVPVPVKAAGNGAALVEVTSLGRARHRPGHDDVHQIARGR